MTLLSPHLYFPAESSAQGAASGSPSSALPPPGTHLLISDTLTAPAHFAVYHVIAAALAQKLSVVWVDFRGEGRTSLEAVLRKLGTTLPPSSSSSFAHLQPASVPAELVGSPSCPSLIDGNDRLTLRPTYDLLASTVAKSSRSANGAGGLAGPLIVLDGLTELCWLGFAPADIGRFVRAALALSRQADGSLVSTVHADHLPLTADTPSKEDGAAGELLERLLRVGQGVWWRVAGLESGRSGDVHGEVGRTVAHDASLADITLISVHPISPPIRRDLIGDWQAIPRSNPLQYRLEERGIRVFAKGTGRGFL